MRFLLWLLAIVSVFWSGYWFIGSRAVEKSAISALSNAAESGYSLEYSSLNTTGFPSRFDTTINDIDFFSPSGLRWTAPFFQVFALSYKPYHIIAVWPHNQSLLYQGSQIDISSSDLRASLVVKPNTTLTLNRFQLTAENIKAEIDKTASLFMGSFSVATRQGAAPLSHDFSIQLFDVSFPSPVNSADIIKIDTASVNTNFMFDGPISRGGPAPNVTAITIDSVKISITEVSVDVSGDLQIDSEGYATGNLSITAQNWEKGFAMLEKLGLIPTDQSASIKTVLRGLSLATTPATEITVPLVVKRGKVFIGFIPIGVIPPINHYLQ